MPVGRAPKLSGSHSCFQKIACRMFAGPKCNFHYRSPKDLWFPQPYTNPLLHCKQKETALEQAVAHASVPLRLHVKHFLGFWDFRFYVLSKAGRERICLYGPYGSHSGAPRKCLGGGMPRYDTDFPAVRQCEGRKILDSPCLAASEL